MCRSRASNAARTVAAVSSGGTWNTPKPNCGISTPLLSRTFGTWFMGSVYPSGPAVTPGTVLGEMSATVKATGLSAGHGARVLFSVSTSCSPRATSSAS